MLLDRFPAYALDFGGRRRRNNKDVRVPAQMAQPSSPLTTPALLTGSHMPGNAAPGAAAAPPGLFMHYGRLHRWLGQRAMTLLIRLDFLSAVYSIRMLCGLVPPERPCSGTVRGEECLRTAVFCGLCTQMQAPRPCYAGFCSHLQLLHSCKLVRQAARK